MNWFKNLGWVKSVGVVLAAVAFAMLGLKATRKGRKIKKQEALVEDLQNSQISKNLTKARKIKDSIDEDKNAVVDAHTRMEIRLEQMGSENEDIDAFADKFNSDRVRRRESAAT